MKDTKFRILLDIHEVRSQVTIPVKVGDVSCKIYITLVEGGKPYKIHENSFGVFTGKKGDDNYLFNNCVIENGVIRYDFTPQTVAASGILECEVRIYDEDGGVLTTPSFTIVVDERAVKDSDLASGTEFTFLDEIIVSEGQRIENERNRIEAFNNMGLSVEDKGDYYILTKTNKDGSKEEFPIGKGEDYVITPEDYKAIADKVVTDTLDAQAAEYFDNLDAQATEHLENIDKNIDGIIDGKVSVVETATGSAITIESSQAPLQNLKLYGKTEQDGTPTPTEPKELKSVGDSGSFNVGVYGSNILDLSQLVIGSDGTYTVNGETITFSGYESIANYFPFGVFVDVEPNTWYTLSVKATSLKSLYVYADWYFGKQVAQVYSEEGKFTFYSASYKILLLGLYSDVTKRTGTSETVTNLMLNVGGEALPYEPCNKQSLTMPYTLRSVMNLPEEIDFTKGTRTNHYHSITINSMSGINVSTTGGATRFELWGMPKAFNYWWGICNRLTVSGTPAAANEVDNRICSYTSGAVFFRCDELANATDRDTWLAEHPIQFIYRLATPIETPLSETELNAYRQLMTNKGNTTILSDADMEVDYYINKPNAQAIGNIHSQINKDYLKLQQAIISTGGSTL